MQKEKIGTLVLSRRPGESVRIYMDEEKKEYIDITTQRGEGCQSKLMIEAPTKYNIIRKELIGRNKK